MQRGVWLIRLIKDWADCSCLVTTNSSHGRPIRIRAQALIKPQCLQLGISLILRVDAFAQRVQNVNEALPVATLIEPSPSRKAV
jgi:hypothetical protein